MLAALRVVLVSFFSFLSFFPFLYFLFFIFLFVLLPFLFPLSFRLYTCSLSIFSPQAYAAVEVIERKLDIRDAAPDAAPNIGPRASLSPRKKQLIFRTCLVLATALVPPPSPPLPSHRVDPFDHPSVYILVFVLFAVIFGGVFLSGVSFGRVDQLAPYRLPCHLLSFLLSL